MDNGGDMLQLCRLCLVKEDVNIPIFEEQGDSNQIHVKISSCLPVKVERNDNLPQNICDSCFSKLDVAYDLWTISTNSEKQLHTWLKATETANNELVKQKRLTKATNKTTDAIVKQEAVEDSFVQEVTWDEASSSAGPSVTVVNQEEPPPKRARRAAAVKASITVAAESDDDDDDAEPMTKMEEDSDDEDDPDATFGEVPSTSADDQPGPSGVGKDGAEAPDIMSLLMPEVSIQEGALNAKKRKSTARKTDKKEKSFTPKNAKLKSPKKERNSPKKDQNENKPKSPRANITSLEDEEICIKDEYDDTAEYDGVIQYLTQNDTRVFECSICKDEVQRTLPDLKKHYKTDHKGTRFRAAKYSTEEHPCEVCGKVFKTVGNMKDHQDIHLTYYHCETCSSGFRKLLDYIIHLRSHSDENQFKCLVCELQTEDINVITKHVNENHAEGFPSKYNCYTCNKGFNLRAWYKEHRNYHTGYKPFCCDICETSFMYSRFLQAHHNFMHKEEKSDQSKLYVCVFCKKEYQHRNSLNVHMNVHTGNYSICDICGKQLSSKEKLKFHLRTHTGFKPFSCTYCNKSFTKKPILVEHIRTHTGERPYNCEYCSKAFSQRSSLVIHTRGHTGEKPYVCNFCTKGFVAKAMLNIHMKSCKGLL